ncbi:MAG: hypothetical protein HY553_14230, partial [Elusimicrobia bacterium]|nr:hypothetical protein [Elusimicrobiota bacterium]
ERRHGGAPPRQKLAGLAVHSKDYALKRKDGVIEEWTGDVYYHQLERDVWADWAERRHDGDRWHLRGRVRAVWRMRDRTVLEASGHEARHDGERDTGHMLPLPGSLLQFSRKHADIPEPDRGVARRLDWDMRANRMVLDGDVRTWGPSGKSWADRAAYDVEGRRLELTGGRPVLVSGATDWNGAVQADRVSAADRPRGITADGKVRGWVLFEDRPARMKALR